MRATSRPHTTLAAALALLPLALAGCLGGEPAAPAADASTSLGRHESVQAVEAEQVYQFPFGSRVPVRVQVDYVVESGGAVDAWLGTAEQCARFGFEDFAPKAESLNRSADRFSARFAPGNLCVILDNTNFAGGEAKPTGPVTVRFSVEMWELSPLRE